MSRWHMIVDVAECTNCGLCSLACQDEFVGNSFPGYSEEMPRRGKNWIEIKQKVRGQWPMIDVAYLPVMCQHCDDAPCMEAAENGAISKRADGIVLIDPVKAKGQKHLVDACPYGAITWNEEREVPQSWFFDAHLLDAGWKEPRGPQVCATKALVSVKASDGDMREIVQREGLEELRPDLNTQPRVWYKNLSRYTKCFVGGSVTVERDGGVECIDGAKVSLLQNDVEADSVTTDYFGDFKFENLPPESGAYVVVITADGYEQKRIELSVSESVYLGEIELTSSVS
jgi:Fe-S-cluster-containing dehydrogenase component